MIRLSRTRLPFIAAACLLLAACSSSLPSLLPGEPALYKHLDAREAKVDEAEARNMLSIYRNSHGLPPVVIDPKLVAVAQTQALAMARADHLSHTVDGDLPVRLARENVAFRAADENVSAGYDTLAEAFSGWRQSPHHNANMLDPRMHRMGIATAYAPGSKYKVYWSLVMAD